MLEESIVFIASVKIKVSTTLSGLKIYHSINLCIFHRIDAYGSNIFEYLLPVNSRRAVPTVRQKIFSVKRAHVNA